MPWEIAKDYVVKLGGNHDGRRAFETNALGVVFLNLAFVQIYSLSHTSLARRNSLRAGNRFANIRKSS